MSIWLDSCKLNNYDKLNSNKKCDICIIGGGITGISTAYYLSQKGFSVIILEKDLIANKTSGNTTAKITSQHNLFYNYLLKSFGLNFAKDYFEANEYAKRNIKNIIDKYNINCDFEYTNSFVFTQEKKNIQLFKDEIKALKNINPDASFEHSLNIPLNIVSAIKFPNQAQFNPIKYLNGLVEILEKNNVYIFENSKVVDIHHNFDSYTVSTELSEVECKYVVMATRYPFVNFPGFHFLKMYQSMAYAIAIDTNLPIINDMYISFDTPTISLRNAIYNNKRIPIIAGFDHRTGLQKDSQDSYLFLEQIAKKLYPDFKIISKWCTEDSISVDKLPYIGEFSTFLPHMYLACGFKKWGMTTSNIAANIICDMICEKENKYSYLFDSKRFHPIKNFSETKNMLKEASESLIIKKIKTKEFDISKIPADSGKVLKYNNKIIGIYKDSNENIFAVKPICSHFGCELTWNNTLKTWDCPCHGSRYNYNGKCIYGPSIGNLEKYEL